MSGTIGWPKVGRSGGEGTKKGVARNKRWLPQANGRAVKVIAHPLPHLPMLEDHLRAAGGDDDRGGYGAAVGTGK